MKLQRINNHNNLKDISSQITTKVAKKFAKMGDIGEGTSIACDFFGKALIVPVMIMTTSKESQEKKEFSAFKNPVAAIIQLALEVPILSLGSKIIEKCANKGMFDIEESDFSYNENLKRTEFVDTFEKNIPSMDNTLKEFLNEVKSNGYSKRLQEQFDDIIYNLDEPTKKVIKSSFSKYEKTFKNQFHLKNRVCYIAALILTPLLCALENKFHPIIMDKIFKLQHLDTQTNVINKSMTFDKSFQNLLRKQGIIKWK